ncbi:unnamed protein product, partial [Rotaria sordida]
IKIFASIQRSSIHSNKFSINRISLQKKRKKNKMPPKAEFKPKPSSKSEKNKPKGGHAKDEKRAAEKAKREAKAGGGSITLGGKK